MTQPPESIHAATQRIQEIFEKSSLTDDAAQKDELQLMKAVAGMQASHDLRASMLQSLISASQSTSEQQTEEDDDDFNPLKVPATATWEELLVSAAEGRDRWHELITLILGRTHPNFLKHRPLS